MNISGKTFIVTGGASGLGEATTKAIVANGGNVIIADLNEEAGNALTTELGAQTRFAKTNVTDEASAQGAVDMALDAFGGLQGLVNCAGVGTPGKVVGRKGPLPLDSFMFVVNVNLIGTFNMIRLAAAAMQNGEADEGGERGVIINTASVAAFDGQIGQAAYAASKGGVVAMTLPIAREMARSGIRVMTIAPGIFETPMLMTLPQEAQDSLGKQVPFPSRLGRPVEFASLAKQIIENPMLNGEVIRLDGAIRMAPK
jgi:NAD(P)-dependent dehydrogenase (short-subunit alcohol dehydrogenase family)